VHLIGGLHIAWQALVFLYTRQDGHDARLASLKDAKAKEAKAKIGGGFCFFLDWKP